MRIGIDCRTILNPASGERAGVGHYTYHLVKALLAADQRNHYTLFFDFRMAHEGLQEFIQPNVKIKFFPFSSYGKFLPFAYSHMLVSAYLLRERLDIFHAPANVIPLSYPKRAVVTIHDLAIFQHPEWFPTQIVSTRLLVPQTLRRAKHVIAVSDATKRDLIDLFNLPDQKVSVIPEAVDVNLLPLQDAEDNIREMYQLPDRYVLFVGTIEPRKNLRVLFEAWQQLQLHAASQMVDVELVLAGGLGHRGRDIVKLFETMHLNEHASYLGYVTHNHKIKLMQEASALVFPTLYEGFGLPVLEAMTLGTPVITTNTSSIPEVTGKAAVLVEPTDVAGLTDALLKVLTKQEFAAELAAQGKRQAAKFSWERAALETLAVYRQAAT